MTKRIASENSRIEKIRHWIREERRARSWSANRLAQEAISAAVRRGESTDVKQQSISSVENGQTKNIPAWVPYIAYAFEDNPAHDLNIVLPKCDRTSAIPNEKSLKKIFLGVLAPLEIDIPLEKKNYLADVLAKKFPFWLENSSRLYE